MVNPLCVAFIKVLLTVLVSRWFLVLAALVGVNQWLFVGVGSCPASLGIERGIGIERGCRR